jgi:uncharacterized protein YnzC (UPF0291/DUF896 family)
MNSDNSDASSLQIQMLEKQFYLVTKQYEKVRLEYIQSLKREHLETIHDYSIIGLGTDGQLYSKDNMTTDWVKIEDNTSNCKGICTNTNDNVGLIGIGDGNNLFQKALYTDDWTPLPGNTCCVSDIVMGHDGSILGIGFYDNQLYRKNSLYEDWNHANNPQNGEFLFGIAISPSGVLYSIGSNFSIWKKESYRKTENQFWLYVGTLPNIVSFSFTPDDILVIVNNDGNILSNPTYKTSFTDGFLPVSNGCCVTRVAFVKASAYKNKTRKYKTMQGSTFWGSGEVKIENSISIEDCEALCSADPLCTGATYNPSDHEGISYCWTRKGDGYIGGGLENDYAIVTPMKANLQQLMELDMQLKTLSQQIETQIEDYAPTLNAELQQKDVDKDKLQQMYASLQDQRNEIEAQMMELNAVDVKFNDATMYVHQKNLAYIFLTILVIIFIAILIRMWIMGSFPIKPADLFNRP